MIRQRRLLAADARTAAELAVELRQPLAAASNYIATAQLLLASASEHPTEIVECLDKAGQQVFRAGVILRKLEDQIAGRIFQGPTAS